MNCGKSLLYNKKYAIGFTLIIIVCLSIIPSCECVNDLDTPKEVSPSNGANLIFFNACYDFTGIKIITSSGTLIDKLLYASYNPVYKKIGINSNFIRIYSLPNDSNIYNSSLDLSTDKYYSMFSYLDHNTCGTIILNDSLTISNATKLLPFRIVNVATNWESLDFKISGQNHLLISKTETSSILSASANQISIIISDGQSQTQLFSIDIELSTNRLNTLVVYNGHSDLPEIRLITTPIHQ